MAEMSKLPDKIDPTYIIKINPPSAGAAEVARTLNQIITYLQDRERWYESLERFANPVDELIDRKLGPRPEDDPDLKR